MERSKRGRQSYVWMFWCLILWISALLRLSYPDWDQGIAAHPDERFLIGVAQNLSLYGNLCEVSPEFPYGHLPVTFLSLIAKMAPGADTLYSGRLISGVAGVFLVALAGRCGLQLSRSQLGGLLSAVLAAFCPFLIQQAHFYTVDPWMAVFGTLAVLFAMGEKWLLGGIAVGLAIACKASAVWVGVSLGAAMIITTSTRTWIRSGLRLALGASVGLFFGAPWLLLTPLRCWRGPLIQALLVTGRYRFPYTRQYAGTLPFVYPLIQMFLWGMGPPIAIVGTVTLLRDGAILKRIRKSCAIALFATVIFFFATAGLYVKYPRYLLPIYPLWIGFAAKGMYELYRFLHWRVCRWGSLSAVLMLVLITSAMGVAEASVYRGVHPWAQASRWIYDNVIEGTTIVVESWDHPLPVPLPAGDPLKYDQVTIPTLDRSQILTPDLEELDRLQGAEIVILASRRNYGVVARQPQRYEALYTWYEALFEEREALVFSRCPSIGPFALSDNPLQGLLGGGVPTTRELCDASFVIRLPRLDESFRVYASPTTVILISGQPSCIREHSRLP